MNDAIAFNSLPNKGPNGGLTFPPETFILGDKIYPYRYAELYAGLSQRRTGLFDFV